MANHQMKLTSSPFEKIISGEKIIESRICDEKRQRINIGDQIEFSNTDDLTRKIKTKVKALYQYESFDDLFSDFPPEYFGGSSKKELLVEIEKFYSEREQKNMESLG